MNIFRNDLEIDIISLRKKGDDLEIYVYRIERRNDNWKACIVTVITEDRNLLHINCIYLVFALKINMLIFSPFFKKLGEEDRNLMFSK